MLTCEKCGKQFIRYKSMIKPGITHFFCSRARAKEHLRNNTGKEHSYPKIFGTHAHRILAEEVIGRPLKKGEVVHHKDGNPRNNLIDNLEVLSSQVEHAKLHCKNGRFS